MTSEFFYVYVLQSESTGRFYVGQTSDLVRRHAEHNDPTRKRTKHTSKDGPWTLVWSERHSTRSAAMLRERFIKSRKSASWIVENLLNGRASPDVHRD